VINLEWLKSLFIKRKLVYSTVNEADYMRVMNRLDAGGVPYVLKSNGSNRDLGSQWSNLQNPTEYNFYVKVENEGRAYKAINQR
jgi:hypothetical protein